MAWVGGTPESQRYGPDTQQRQGSPPRPAMPASPVSEPRPLWARINGWLERRLWIFPAEVVIWAPLIFCAWLLAMRRILPLTVLDLWYPAVQIFWGGLGLLAVVGIAVSAWRARRQRPASGALPAGAASLVRHRQAALPTGRSIPRALAVALGVLAAPTMPWLYTLYAQPDSSPAASWSTQLAFAQLIAAREDPSAVVESVDAKPVRWAVAPPPIDQNTTLELDFIFRGRSNTSVRVEIADSDPPRLIQVSPGWDQMVFKSASGENLSPALLERDKQILSSIALSPRDVYRQTLATGITFGREHGGWPRPEVSLYLQHDWAARGWGVPTGWNMTYYAGNNSINLRMNPQTGRVIVQESQ